MSRAPNTVGRRGLVYLFSALLLATILLVIIYSQALPTRMDREQSVVTRITTIDDFLKDFHADVHRATYISGYRALIAVEQHISDQGLFVTNTSPVFVEAFMNGTIDGTSFDILSNSTFSEYLVRVGEQAELVGIGVNASVTAITLGQSTPWSVDITFNVTVNVTDLRGLARWDYEKAFTTEVPILDLRDPAYSVATYGKVPNTIRQSPYNNSDFVSGSNTSVLDDEIDQMYYREDPHAPSFLQRLNGSLTASSKYGIASLVDLDELNAQGLLPDLSRSVVDYRYFSGANTTNWCPGFGAPLPPWFKLDDAHYLDSGHDYELPKLNATTC